MCQGPISHNNEQTQSVEGIIWFNSNPAGRMSAITYCRWIPVTSHTIYIVGLSSRIYEEYTTDGFISITGHCRRRYTWFTQLCICPRNTLKLHGCVLWPKPVTINNFIINTGHCRRHYASFTLLCETPPNTLILHGRILRPIPVTTQGFIFVSHYYWGAGRPE